ncbi:MAG: ribosome biogenesis GTPase YlqF [Ruminococcaceae bacterium]|nr:ribosome biogenesis GTPase YlqF [Oscillospiraceae bacterium]
MQNLQWYPGHMAKTRRMIEENIKNIDVVVEILDARVPYSGRNPNFDDMIGHKPRLVVMNKYDLADSAVTDKWINWYNRHGIKVIPISCATGMGINKIAPVAKELVREKLDKAKEKGMNINVKIMMVGIPNVGKSTLINKLCGKSKAKTGDKPGVTREKQWIRLMDGLELLDTPGILPPKFDDQRVAVNLAYTGAIRDEIMEIELLCHSLLDYMRDNYKDELCARYKLDSIEGLEGYEILEKIGRKRGCVISGGEIDTERAANILIDELRGCKICPVTLEKPEDFEQ